MSMSAIGSISSWSNGNVGMQAMRGMRGGGPPDPSQMLEESMTRLDTDEDGYLSNSEVSSLSSDTFSVLDTDGDGKLSTDEIKTAMDTQMQSMKKAMEEGDSTSFQDVMDSLKDTAEGQLMEALKPEDAPSGPPPGPPPSSAMSSYQQNSDIWSSLFSGNSNSSSASSLLGLNLTA